MAMSIPMTHEDQRPLDDFSACLQHESWTRQQLEDYQARALHACRAYAYAHSPFYQRFHRGLIDRPLHELPVLTKAMMMEQFDELVTDRAVRLRDVQEYLARADASKLFLDRYRVMATSGSSGRPGVFLYDRAEGVTVGNSYNRCTHWGGITPESRAAVVASTAPAHMTTRAPITANGQQVARLQLSANEPLETIVQRLNEWQPDTLFLYPSIAAVLADEQRQGRLRVTPQIIFCGSEAMPGETRRRIEDVWQTRLFDIYGTTEGGVLAAECSFHQGLHIFEDFSIVEVVDQDNRPVPPGEQGDKVLLTVLFRRTQPLIRYELSDLVRTSTIERCPCGRPFFMLEAIQGRTIEVLYLQSLTGGEERIFPYLFENVFNTQPVSAWQVVQEQDGLHIFLTGASEELQEEQLLAALRQALTRRGVIVPPIAIHRVTALNRNASGKTPTVLSRVPRRAA
jgi:phenylacetate-coenzyme A ligase PaaK-like adenylate-forming protein